KQVPVLGAATPLQLSVVIVKSAPAAPPPTETRMIGGIVLDANRAPVVGATVRVHGTAIQTVTGADGSFTLPGVAVADVALVVELAPDQTTLDVPLALSKGEQIVIEGRAPVIVKTNLANGASVIDDKDLNRVSAQTIDAAMTAKLAGSNIQANSGAPGGGAQL